MTRVIHVPFGYYPDPVGGTEVYVENLIRSLAQLDVESMVAAPDTRGESEYRHAGVAVRRFALHSTVSDIGELYGEGDLSAARAFGRILDDALPDAVHLHAFTRGVSLRLARAAIERHIPLVFTYHTPTVSCQRGTLLRWGTEVCDGLLDVGTCTGCTLHGLGLSRKASTALGSVPASVGRAIGRRELSGGLWTSLRMTALVERHHVAVRQLLSEVDHVVALCAWAKDLLVRNGVAANKISLSRHGLSEAPFQVSSKVVSPKTPGVVRIAFLGRMDPTKGADVLIRALRALPAAAIQLDLYGIIQGGTGDAYVRQLTDLADGDTRIALLPPIPSDQVSTHLSHYDALAVPSVWLETGPLVVLEAFAAGVPVLGSNLGGIAEIVKHEVDGLLIEPGSPAAWSHALQRILQEPELIGRLRSGIHQPRRMSEVAREMLALYQAGTRSALTTQQVDGLASHA